MKIERYPYTARAWCGRGAGGRVRRLPLVETAGEPSVLYFPRDDIVSAPSASGRDDATGAPDAVRWTADGQQVLRLVTEPTLGRTHCVPMARSTRAACGSRCSTARQGDDARDSR